MRRTKIVATIGPASRSPQLLRQLVHAGMDVARLNFSHGDAQFHQENVARIRSVAQAEGRPVAIQVDLQGPKFRIGELPPDGLQLALDETVVLSSTAQWATDPPTLPVQNERFPDLVSKGDRILIDDGLIELRAESSSADQVHCQVVVAGTVTSNKGINLPGVSTELPSLTHKDRQDLAQALDWDVDWIALSFVRRAADIEALRTAIRQHTQASVPIMAKIEKPEALKHIDEIIAAADAVMVARGDLGIEIPPEQVPMAQKHIIERCNEAGVPVVTATQMLDAMIRNPRPTRAEASDVANALLDGTDAVMLSGETAIGNYPVKALETMVRIIQEVESQQSKIPVRPFRPLEESTNLSIARAIAHAARQAADNLSPAAILAITASGYTARIVARYRPAVPIMAITPEERVQRRLMLHWGVTPLVADRSHNTDEMITTALETLQARHLVSRGDLVAITAGTAGSEPGTTNLLRIQVVE